MVATYDTVKQSLPTIETIDTFVSAHPVAIAQLAIQYCDALVRRTSSTRTTYFPGFNFGAAPAVGASTRRGRAIVLDALVGRMVDPALATDPDVADVRARARRADHAADVPRRLAPRGRTETIVKATCAALLGSAVTLVH